MRAEKVIGPSSLALALMRRRIKVGRAGNTVRWRSYAVVGSPEIAGVGKSAALRDQMWAQLECLVCSGR